MNGMRMEVMKSYSQGDRFLKMIRRTDPMIQLLLFLLTNGIRVDYVFDASNRLIIMQDEEQ